jgi:hypothetical protein
MGGQKQEAVHQRIAARPELPLGAAEIGLRQAPAHTEGGGGTMLTPVERDASSCLIAAWRHDTTEMLAAWSPQNHDEMAEVIERPAWVRALQRPRTRGPADEQIRRAVNAIRAACNPRRGAEPRRETRRPQYLIEGQAIATRQGLCLMDER